MSRRIVAAKKTSPVIASRLVVIGGSIYVGAEAAVDKLGHALPAAVVGEATHWRTVRRIGAVAEATCSYLDGRGVRCDKSCHGQVALIEGMPYCFRHAGIAEALAARRGTVYEIWPPPDVDDRGFNLLITLCRETGPRVLALLHNRFPGGRVRIVADEQPRRIRLGTSQEWELGWWATIERPVSRIALRATASFLPEVTVMVDHVRRFTTVPDWTSTRSPAGRLALWHGMVAAVRRAVDEEEGGRPAWVR